MNALKTILAAGAMTIALIGVSNAAWYAKFDGVDGDVQAASWGGGNTLWLTTGEDPTEVGLLLPAVQTAREAARNAKTSAGRPKKFSEFELTDTSAGKSWTLYDAVATPAGGNRVRIDYRCKDLQDLRTGEMSSDCPQAFGADERRKKGKVDASWKVEEGES